MIQKGLKQADLPRGPVGNVWVHPVLGVKPLNRILSDGVEAVDEAVEEALVVVVLLRLLRRHRRRQLFVVANHHHLAESKLERN